MLFQNTGYVSVLTTYYFYGEVVIFVGIEQIRPSGDGGDNSRKESGGIRNEAETDKSIRRIQRADL